MANAQSGEGARAPRGEATALGHGHLQAHQDRPADKPGGTPPGPPGAGDPVSGGNKAAGWK